jgi:hypothetical protein
MRFLLLLACFGLPLFCGAHAVPDIPVRTYFAQDGTFKIMVEVDPRCFSADPNTAASLLKPIYLTLPEERKSEL